MTRFAHRGVYAIVDDRVHASYGVTRLLREIVEQSAIPVVQIRAKNSSLADIQGLVSFAANLKKHRPFCLIVNDWTQAASWSGVDGIHWGQSDLQQQRPEKILGISARTEELLACAMATGADYVGAGAVFPTTSKDDAETLGLVGLQTLVRLSAVPIVAIGGITRDTIVDVAKTRCAMAAVLSGLVENDAFVGNELHDAFC